MLIWAYRYFISPLLGPHCRFQPTCSAYAGSAYQNFSFIPATWLVAKRICKCHPFGGQGYDPLPLEKSIDVI